MKKAAVIGLGTTVPIHLDAITRNPEIQLAGVCDCDEIMRKNAPSNVPFSQTIKR